MSCHEVEGVEVVAAAVPVEAVAVGEADPKVAVADAKVGEADPKVAVADAKVAASANQTGQATGGSASRGPLTQSTRSRIAVRAVSPIGIPAPVRGNAAANDAARGVLVALDAVAPMAMGAAAAAAAWSPLF